MTEEFNSAVQPDAFKAQPQPERFAPYSVKGNAVEFTCFRAPEPTHRAVRQGGLLVRYPGEKA